MPRQPFLYSGPKVKCPDCGATYVHGAPHYIFCKAKTCENCGTTFESVGDLDENGLCEECADV